jgi:hypothetical protein
MLRTANFFDADVQGEGDSAVMKNVADGARVNAAKIMSTACASGGPVYALKP